MRRFIALIFFIAVSVLGIANAEDTAAQSFPIPNHGQLELAFPVSWEASLRQPPRDLPPTIRFIPKGGNQFELLVTVLWSMKPGLNINEPSKIKALVTQSGKDVLMSAVEKRLDIIELKSGNSIGYYFFLTDKAPLPGEYKYMMQGIMGIGELQLAFTFLTNEKNSDAQKSTLNMLTSARQKK